MILAALTVAGFYVVLCAYVYVSQEGLIFYPCRDRAVLPERSPIESVTFVTSDGETLHGWYLRADGDAPRKTALFFHGNGGCVAGLGYQLDAIRSLGMNGLVFDYRGYGESSGAIRSEDDLYEDARAAVGFLNSQGIQPADIVLWGQSMGGGVATEIASTGGYNALILDSTFYSMEEMAAGQYPYLPTKLLLKYRFRNGAKVPSLNMPKLVIHSREDGVVPYAQSERLFDAAAGPKTFLATRGSHVGAYFDDEAVYIGGIREFLEKI